MKVTAVRDLRGEDVKVGDTIAYAATDGRSGGMRVGKVVEIVPPRDTFDRWDKEKKYPNRQPTKLKVSVEHTSGLYSGIEGKTTLIQADFKRFVLVEKAPPAPPVPKTIDERFDFEQAWDAKVDADRAKQANK